ncbi:unnamed protein product [Peniophora sp. CBMAI 1063]|nr:unnamed protein product [Peniophora sp. CBMAI 1063]
MAPPLVRLDANLNRIPFLVPVSFATQPDCLASAATLSASASYVPQPLILINQVNARGARKSEVEKDS